MNDQFDHWHESDSEASLEDVSSNIDTTNRLLEQLNTKIDDVRSSLNGGMLFIVIVLTAHVIRHW